MTLDDKQVEALLRKLPLSRPSTSLDARVMARPTIKIWSYVGVGSALAAAAAVLIVVAMNWTVLTGGSKVAVNPPDPLPTVSNGTVAPEFPDLQRVSVVPVVDVIDVKIIPASGNQPPMQQVTQEKYDKEVWVDKINNTHIETKSNPHREVIFSQVEVK